MFHRTFVSLSLALAVFGVLGYFGILGLGIKFKKTFVALLASILPPTLIILVVVSLLHRIRREAWVTSFIEGLTPAIVMVILFAAWKIFQKGDTGWQGWVFAGVSTIALLLGAPERLVVLAAAILGVFFFS